MLEGVSAFGLKCPIFNCLCFKRMPDRTTGVWC